MQKIDIREEITLSPYMKDVYRRIHTNLQFTGVENKVICVTSCTSNEGKSEISFEIAKSFSESGKRVLLLDSDMRNTVLHHRLNIPHDLKGLSHYLSGQVSGSDVIYSTNVDKLFLTPAGKVPNNPTSLLSNERFNTFIDNTRKVFDYIIVDTAPLGLVIDAAVVAKVCDGSVLVVAANNNTRRAAMTVKEQLIAANPNLLGVILNKVEKHSKQNGYGYGGKYGYGYGGKYGYGYGGSYGKSYGQAPEETPDESEVK